MPDDLSTLKDDMNAFILGHGLSRFQGYVTEEVHSVMWDPRDNPESWKDFVELAKKAGAEFLSMDEEVLERDELDYLIQRLQHASYPSDEDMEEARWLRNYVGKTGFIQWDGRTRASCFFSKLLPSGTSAISICSIWWKTSERWLSTTAIRTTNGRFTTEAQRIIW